MALQSRLWGQKEKELSYTLVRTVALPRTVGSQWIVVDTTNKPLKQLYNDYYKLYVELSHLSLTENIYVDLDTIRHTYVQYPGTIADLLVALGDITFTTVEKLPSDTIKYVKYSDAFRSNYKVDLTKIGYSLPDNYPISLKDDAVLTRPKYSTNMRMLHTHALVTVNGYVHETDADDDHAYIYDAGKTLRKSRNNSIGILSFAEIGEINKIHLVEERIHTSPSSTSLYERTYIDTGMDLSGKSYFLVLGGYIILPEDQLLWKVNDTTLGLNLGNMPYVERFYESDADMDLTTLNIERDQDNPGLFNINQLKSNEFIKSYLIARNSFVVVLNTNHMVYNKNYLRHSNLPGMFKAYQEPEYPLVVNYGRIAEYWKSQEDGQWLCTVNDSYLRDYVIDFYTETNLELINNHLVPMTPNKHSRGFLLEIGCYNI